MKCGDKNTCPPTIPTSSLDGYYQCQETAFGYGDYQLHENRWGWYNSLTVDQGLENIPIYEGAGRNVISE